MEIDLSTCKNCGTCAAVCPFRIPDRVNLTDGSFHYRLLPERIPLCMKCGHCMAACPSASIHIDGLSYEKDFFPLPANDWDGEGFTRFISTRRSVRQYQNKPVSRETLRQIADAMTLAPMGFTPHNLEVTIIEERRTIEKALPHLLNTYEKLYGKLQNPFMRPIIRNMLGPEKYNALTGHLYPTLASRLADMKAGKTDTFTRGAPALFLVHAPKHTSNAGEDAFILVTYGLLAAHALGLGAAALSILPQPINRSPELRHIFQIPAENEVLTTMVVGYPGVHFKRGIRRELAGVHWVSETV